MLRNKILLTIAVLTLVAMACSINIDLPNIETDIKTGPIVTEDISIQRPDQDGITELEIAFGAGEIFLSPGTGDALVSGTAAYNVEDFKPEILTEGNRVSIEQGNLEISGLPNFSDRIENTWDLQISQDPIELEIKAGAYSGEYEFGGLNISNLRISDGAANVELRFSSPNQADMDTFRYETGASDVTLTGLANANFSTMIFQSGAGDYELEFDGELQKDTTVIIESGLSNFTITVPEGVNAIVDVDGALNNVNTRGEWDSSGGDYLLDGDGPTLTISVELGAGNLTLRN